MKSIHDQDTIQCDKCSYKTSTKTKLNRHTKLNHLVKVSISNDSDCESLKGIRTSPIHKPKCGAEELEFGHFEGIELEYG